MVILQSLWIGKTLSNMEVCCINSFLKHGFTFHLYTYEPVKRVPKGTIIKDANEIMPKQEVFKLKETFLPFSDIWRYKLMYLKGNYWVDMDMICLRPFNFRDKYIFSSERTIQKGAYAMSVPYVANIGILKAPKGSPFFKELFEICDAHHKKGKNKDKIKYMRILRKLIEKYGYEKYVKTPDYFCNLDWWYAKDAFLPVTHFKDKYGVPGRTYAEVVKGRANKEKKPYTLHFWRDLATKKYKIDLNDDFDDKCLWSRVTKGLLH